MSLVPSIRSPMAIPSAVALTLAALTLAMPQAAVAESRKATPNPTANATLLGQYGEWGAYTASPGGRKLCFALSRPTASSEKPPNRRSDQHNVYLFVSSRPADKVRDELSILITNYAFQTNSDATMTIGGTDFTLHTQNDGAWTKDPKDESRLIEAMRGGSEARVAATTSRGTLTFDTFSLIGVSQALDRVAKECQ